MDSQPDLADHEAQVKVHRDTVVHGAVEDAEVDVEGGDVGAEFEAQGVEVSGDLGLKLK